jgi:lipopolysaccharide transport system ATP-binding protein
LDPLSGTGRAVVFDGVSKRLYRGRRHDSLRDLLPALAQAAVRGPKRAGLRREPFWALRDVSFRVEPGEVLGIIGPNGAGKSTILKLLNGILRPTEGSVHVEGRVGALIELAAGFHYELTGRENIYLQGAVMGMRREDIRRSFGAIVDFAGIGDFLDTPVKRYSSGMVARLGFSLAAHLEPDVLVVDEVLAVGDYEFQQKAMRRIREIVERDIPVIVVSHLLDRVMRLCDRALLLAGGRVVKIGHPVECVRAYVEGEHIEADVGRPVSPVTIESISSVEAGPVDSGQRVAVRLRGHVNRPEAARQVCVGVKVRQLPGETAVFSTNNQYCEVAIPEEGSFELEVELQMNVRSGLYRVQGMVWDGEHSQEWQRGPSCAVRVEKHRPFYGDVNLLPSMRLLDT